MVRWLGVAVLVLGGSLAAYAQDTDTVSTSAFDVTLTETVRIAVGTQPVGSVLDDKVELATRYFPLGSFKASVWAITNYQVSGGVGLTGTASGALLLLGAAAIRVQIVQATDFGATGDDGVLDNPVSNVTAVSPYTALPLTPAQALWNGGNTEGGDLTYHEATVNLWLDLDQLGNQATGNVLAVTVNLLVTEI